MEVCYNETKIGMTEILDFDSVILLTLNSKLSIEQANLVKKYSDWKKI